MDHKILQALPLEYILKLSTCLPMHSYSLESGDTMAPPLSPGSLLQALRPHPHTLHPTQQLVGLLKRRFGCLESET